MADSERAYEAPAGPVEESLAQLWQGLRQLPAGEARARVVALRQAALSCAVEEGLLSRSPR